MAEVWVYYWKACRNHDKENPSNFTYEKINEKYLDDDEYMKEEALDWADNVDNDGSMYGYKYGWERKDPSEEWLRDKILNYSREIGNLSARIRIFELEIENLREEIYGKK